jgi:hypothetical protein
VPDGAIEGSDVGGNGNDRLGHGLSGKSLGDAYLRAENGFKVNFSAQWLAKLGQWPISAAKNRLNC